MDTFTIFLLAGMALMIICMLWANHMSYHSPFWKVIISGAILTGIGLLGAHIMSWIESGNWTGRSFYGAVFLTPILLWPLSGILKMSYGRLMDLSAPAECVMLALLKAKCRIDGCCAGRVFIMPRGSFQFPSQVVECITAIIIMSILLLMIRQQRFEGKIFPSYMVLYGILRFILNLFRETTPWIGPLAAGNFWSLVSIAFGAASILVLKYLRLENGKPRGRV